MSRPKKVQPQTLPNTPTPADRRSAIPNPDANKTEYDLRPNMGQQFGSQGTLFQVSKRPRTSVGPKGFSPARQDAVRRRVTVSDASGLSVMPAKAALAHPFMDYPEVTGAENHAERQVQDAISRSTVPITHPVDVNVVHKDHHRLTGIGKAYGWNQAAGGLYNSITSIATVSAHTFEPGTGQRQNQLNSKVLLHELGHHHSANNNPDRDYSTAEGAGKEEAYADNFSVTHYPKAGSGQNPAFKRPYTDEGRDSGFREAYDNARTTPTSLDGAFGTPNVPGSERAPELSSEEVMTHIRRNPTIYGMRPMATSIDQDARASGFKSNEAHTNNVNRRQSNAIKDQLAGK